MKPKYIGDSLDYFKAAWIRAYGQILKSPVKFPHLKIDPMWTHRPTRGQLDRYTRTLNLEKRQLRETEIIPFVGSTSKARDRRRKYFEYWTTGGLSGFDIFFDPDTGLEPPSSRDSRIHLLYTDINEILADQPNQRIILVYQHFVRLGKKKHAKYIKNVFREMKSQSLEGVFFDFTHAGIWMISKNRKRLNSIKSKIKKKLYFQAKKIPTSWKQ